jgi:hypothetical protein
MNLNQGLMPMKMNSMPDKGPEDGRHDRDTLNNLGGLDVDPCTRIRT